MATASRILSGLKRLPSMTLIGGGRIAFRDPASCDFRHRIGSSAGSRVAGGKVNPLTLLANQVLAVGGPPAVREGEFVGRPTRKWAVPAALRIAERDRRTGAPVGRDAEQLLHS